MEIIESVQEMQEKAEALRMAGYTIGLVPTMGFLHEGHLELMRVAKKLATHAVVSIFVNPSQFGPNEDFERYPRDREGDLAKAESVGVDVVFLPTAQEMYPAGFQTRVQVLEVTQHLCGLSRPTHFDGVATVVTKLFHITRPHIAVFGQKDFQQLTVISRMTADLDMGIEIVGVPIVREADGLAMSSRNKYLGAEERIVARCLKKGLELAQDLVRAGERDAAAIRRTVEALISGQPFTRIDYISLADPETLEEVAVLQRDALMALAVFVGSTRLIDNAVLEVRA
ncbi:pantoate--beta-alanine ligase [Desulfatiglans anilini]|uniref:pantoate--beta-alanine ligase n=1 Tax=Desulfatiglans anilini TaxID=90728 RepID=UPI0003FE91AE|nr:pantoate--beta-alanine ligase [Desulfatiglans anilini]